MKSRRMRWVGNVAHTEDRRGAYRVLVGNIKERNNLENLCIGEDNIKMDLKEKGW
jgi:hypothetical protein